MAIEENPASQFFGQGWIPESIERHLVFFFYLVARVSEMLGEIAIVGEQKQTLGLRVEPADIEEPGKFCRQQVENRVPGMRIAPGGNKAGRLVEEDRERLFWPNELVIDLDVVARLDLGAEIGARLTVHRHAPGSDELVTMPARPEPGGGEESVEAHFSRESLVES